MSDFRKLLILLVVLALARAVYACAMPMVTGESYYWLWNWHPAAGYFDHPPMVGLFGTFLGGRVLGSTSFARLPAILLSLLSTLAMYGLGRSMFPAGRAAWLGAFIFALAPILDLNGIFLGPDNALILFTTLTWLSFWRAAAAPERLGLWALAGIAAGLALLSKFHAWVMLPPLHLFLIISPPHRKILKTPGPWLALALALLVLSPNLIWNARHDWLNYAFQWNRSALPRARFNPNHLLAYLFGPLATLSPLLYCGLLPALWRGFLLWRREHDPRWLYLICAGAPLPIFLGALSLVTGISLHWPAPAYGALILLFAALHDAGKLFSPRLFRATLALMLCCTAMIHIAPFALPLLPNEASSPKLASKLGTARAAQKSAAWPEIGALARRHRDALLREHPDVPAIIMALNWHTTSNLLFYARLPMEGSPLTGPDLHNWRLWNAARGGLRGANAVVVIEKEEPNEVHKRFRYKYDKYHRMLDPLFESVAEQPSLVVYADHRTEEYLGIAVDPPRLREFLVFRCTGFKGHFIDEGAESN